MKNTEQRLAEVAELFGFSAGPAPFSLDGIAGLDEMGVPDVDAELPLEDYAEDGTRYDEDNYFGPSYD